MKSVLIVLMICSVCTAWIYNRHGNSFARTFQQQVKQYTSSSSYKDLIPVYEGKNIEFGFPSERVREHAIQGGLYDPDKPIPIDVDVYYELIPRIAPSNYPRIFITIPRFGAGVPYSLAYLTDVQGPNGSVFQPYPDYSWHTSHGSDCNGLTSVYRIQIDSCGQMWVLDSGEIGFVQSCPPSVVVFDLRTDIMIHRYFLPDKMYKTNASRFVTPYIDIADPAPDGNCQHAVAYLADPTGTGFVVYDVLNERSWRIENKFTYPDPDFGTHTIAGESFELLDGVFGFALTPPGLGLRRMLFFHSLSHDMEVAIPIDIVNNETVWDNGIASGLQHFIPLGRRGVQCAIPVMTANGYLLCGFLEPIAIYGWNICSAYTPKNRIILAENPITLQFISGMKIIRNPNTWKDDIWILSNRLQKAFTETINFNEINYRIQRCGVNELLSGRNCLY